MSNDAPAWLQAPQATSAPPPQSAPPAPQPATSSPWSSDPTPASNPTPPPQQQSFGNQQSFGRGGGVDTIQGLSSAYDWKSAFWAQHALRFFFLGCAVFLASVAALSFVNLSDADSDKEAQVIFVSMYLLLFSAIIFTFEITRYFPNDQLEAVFLRNFGVLYGPVGRGFTYAFLGVLALGNVEVGGSTEQLAIAATSITAGFGFIQILLYILRPEWSDPAMEIKVFPNGVMMRPQV